MNIDNLTYGELKQIAAMFAAKSDDAPFTPHIGKECVVRTYASGVHFGTVVAQSGRQVEIKDARRLWKWHAKTGISLSEVALDGIDASKSRICATVPSITITDALELIPASPAAASTIREAPVASK